MSIDEYDEIGKLRSEYPLGTLDMWTVEGRRWKRRMDESERYFNKYSEKWTENRALLCDYTKMLAEFGTYVAIAYPIINNFISDVYFRNPDPFIQDKGGNKDLSKILTDVARSVHAECDTESEMRACLLDQSWAGFGLVAGSFQQKPHDAGQPIMEPTGEIGIDGPVMAQAGVVEPTSQKVLLQRISPWKSRFDPKGRRWDMSDHRYWGYDDVAYLGPLMRELTSDDDRRRLMAYYGQGGAAFSAEGGDSSAVSDGETDPEFIRVCMRTIWSRPDHKIYSMPYGASFTFEPRPWDEEWERADMFPVRYAPCNRVPEDKENTEGFIGQPYLALIGQHIRNINKAQGLLLQGLEHVIDVYVTVKGALDEMSQRKIFESGRMFNVIEFDPKGLTKFPSMQADEKLKMSDIMSLLPTGDTKDMQHMAEIDHEFSLIAQIMGQGPADRGGVSDSETATQSLGQQQGIARRMSANRNDAGKHYNALTRMIFIIIQARHTLPLRYQATTVFNEKVWNEFTDPVGTLKNIDLHCDYATGSNEPQTREQVFATRERMAAILMPIFQAQQNWRMVMKVAQDLIEPLNIIDSDSYFNDEARQIVMQLLTILRGVGKGSIGDQEITADNLEVVKQIPELIAQLAQAILTPQQLAQVEAVVAGVQEPEDGGKGVGSIEKPPSPGEASAEAGAAGSAAAGQTGGLAAHQPLEATT